MKAFLNAQRVGASSMPFNTVEAALRVQFSEVQWLFFEPDLVA